MYYDKERVLNEIQDYYSMEGEHSMEGDRSLEPSYYACCIEVELPLGVVEPVTEAFNYLNQTLYENRIVDLVRQIDNS